VIDAAVPLPVRKAVGFPSSPNSVGGYAARGEASPSLNEVTESQRLSAREVGTAA